MVLGGAPGHGSVSLEWTEYAFADFTQNTFMKGLKLQATFEGGTFSDLYGLRVVFMRHATRDPLYGPCHFSQPFHLGP